MSRGPQAGVYSIIKKTYSLSQKGTHKQQVFVLDCGHAVVSGPDTAGAAQAKARERKWCFLCTDAERKRAERVADEKTATKVKPRSGAVTHIATQLPPGMMVISEERLQKLLSLAGESAVEKALEKLTAPQPEPKFPEQQPEKDVRGESFYHPLQGEG